MNKLKLLYDVVKTMKNKEVLNGVLNVELQKDQSKIFFLQKEFEKNMLTGQTKAKISTELDYEGKKVKHDSNTEFNVSCCDEKSHHGFMKHMHHHHAGKCGGVKGILSKIALALSILNNMQTKEQENNVTVISLNVNELPEEMKASIREKMGHACSCQHHGHHGLLKEFCTIEDCNVMLNMFINRNFEVEKIVINYDGTQVGEQKDQYEMKARAELQFTW